MSTLSPIEAFNHWVHAVKTHHVFSPERGRKKVGFFDVEYFEEVKFFNAGGESSTRITEVLPNVDKERELRGSERELSSKRERGSFMRHHQIHCLYFIVAHADQFTVEEKEDLGKIFNQFTRDPSDYFKLDTLLQQDLDKDAWQALDKCLFTICHSQAGVDRGLNQAWDDVFARAFFIILIAGVLLGMGGMAGGISYVASPDWWSNPVMTFGALSILGFSFAVSARVIDYSFAIWHSVGEKHEINRICNQLEGMLAKGEQAELAAEGENSLTASLLPKSSTP